VYISDAKKKIQSEGLRLMKKSGGEGDWIAVDVNGKPSTLSLLSIIALLTHFIYSCTNKRERSAFDIESDGTWSWCTESPVPCWERRNGEEVCASFGRA
jgi:hypothetical protein